MEKIYINPEIAAHNIAAAYCERHIRQMPDENFVPGDLKHSNSSALKMWELYANIYDAVFEAAHKSNISLTEET